DLRMVLLRTTRMASRLSQCKPNGIVVNTLLGLKIPASPMNPVAAVQHRLGTRPSSKKKPPPKGRLAQLLGTGSLCLEINACARIEELEVIERRGDVVQARVDQVHIGGEVLMDRVEVHIGRVERLFDANRPEINVSAGNFGTDGDVVEGAGREETDGPNAAKAGSGAETVMNVADAAEDRGFAGLVEIEPRCASSIRCVARVIAPGDVRPSQVGKTSFGVGALRA